MQLNTENIKKLIVKMGFSPREGKNNIYFKAYPIHKGYEIWIDFNTEKIEYDTQNAPKDCRIIFGDGTTGNFSHAENFVVLECVDRLLEKGYTPPCIELEKTYPSGRGHSGRLDILVKTPDGQAFLMIECKTWGREYEKEQKKMSADGGQLFTYYKNAVAAKYLCLYSSRLTEDTIEYVTSIVDVREGWASLSEVKDIYEHWNKILKHSGIFEKDSSPYHVIRRRLTYGDLENMNEEDGGKIYNQIMEILRHNGVSDKPNAFNKLLNLFVCKIIDEDRNENDELAFQCWDGLTDEKLQMTLNDLYKEGMWRFLNIDVIDHSMDEINEKLDGMSNAAHKAELMDIISDLRLKKSPNFAFIEVLDDKTFRRNATVVREIVELLQGYRFRYEQKHEFLGNFFELLLNTSMKQEAGQFFTPVPITKFIISSLPLREFVQNRIDTKAELPLPAVIDYACGSGHFLTEFMEQQQKVIEDVDIRNASPSVKKLISSWRDNVKFSWAKEYVYGIDFDNRLVKTTKISAFFNGDGEANIIWGNGLDNFERSSDYRGKLKHTIPGKPKDNGQFDILISNPPYSVQSFRRMLKDGSDTFELYKGLTDNSSEIECLFMERTKQLLKAGGWAGIILPSSVLSNGGIYARARDIIFKYFIVRAIVELGSGTFMKTGTNTVILFLERRPDSDHERVEQAIDTFFADKQDVTVSGIEHAFSKYTENVYGDLTFEDYVSFIGKNPTKTMKEHDLWKDAGREFGDDFFSRAFAAEREKMLYFLLTYDQTVVLVKSGQKQEEKAFLGYEFRERRGQEGIRRLPGGTMLFHEDGSVADSHKVNSYIYNAFLGKKAIDIDDSLLKHVSYGRMSSYFEFGTGKFYKRVNLSKTPEMETQWEKVLLSSVLAAVESGNRPVGGVSHIESGAVSIGGEHIGMEGKPVYDSLKYVSHDYYEKAGRGKIQANDILLCKDGALTGKICIMPDQLPYPEMMVNEHVFILRANDRILQEYLFEFLFSESGQKVIKANITGQAQGGLNTANLRNIRIPLPPLSVQQKIVKECRILREEIEQVKAGIVQLQEELRDRFIDMFGDPVTNPMNWKTELLGNLGTFKNGVNYRQNAAGYMIKCLGVGDFGNYYTIQGVESLSEISLSSEVSAEYLLKDGDIVFVRSNGNAALVGRSVEVFPGNDRLTYSGFCIRYRNTSDKVLTAYLNHALHLPSVKAVLLKDGKGANIKNLNQRALASLKVPLPPVSLQESFSEFVKATEQKKAQLQQVLCANDKKYREVLKKYL